MTGDFTCDITPMTDQELVYSRSKLACAMRVLLTLADIKQIYSTAYRRGETECT